MSNFVELAFEHWFSPEIEEKHFIGNMENQECRFCGKDKATTTFSDEAHAIPAAFGNRTLFTHEECDSCNKGLGRNLENDLANSLALMRGMARTRRRPGKGNTKIKKRSSFIESNPTTNTVHVYQDTSDTSVEMEDLGSNKAKISVDVPQYRPMNMAKAIARMGIQVLDQADIAKLPHVMDWIKGNFLHTPTIFHTFIPGTGFYDGHLSVFHKPAGEFGEYYVVVFGYSACILSMVLPVGGWTDPDKNVLSFLEIYYGEPMPDVTTTMIKINEDIVRKDQRDSVVISYEGKTFVPDAPES